VSAAPALELRALSAAYGPYRALFDVALSVEPGEFVALVGPNGAGKSTVVRVVAGLVPVGGGEVRLAGRPVTGWAPWRIARAGLSTVPEGRAVFAGLSVEEHLRLTAAARGMPRTAIGAVYDAFPMLAGRRRQRAGTLSGGQQRLLALAGALVGAPSVVMVDELTFGLSAVALEDVAHALRSAVVAGSAVVAVEQDLERAPSGCTRAVVLDRGRVRYDGAIAGARSALRALFEALPPEHGTEGG
jgi:branched-chain amino acid transport system ATP-binding protein